MYYSTTSAYPLQYHLCPPSLLAEEHQPTTSRTDFFMSPTLSDDLHANTIAALQTLTGTKLPEYVHVYHSLMPINTETPTTRVFGYPTWAYRAVSNRDGKVYCLRRIEGYRLTNEKAISIVQVWKTVTCANVVGLHEAFTTRAFGDNSLLFVYDYFPNSKTLEEVHFMRSGSGCMIQEKLIWSYMNQLVSGLKVIHSKGLAARLVDSSRILVTGKARIRFNCSGIFDVLHYEHGHAVAGLQQGDIQNLGKLLVALCTTGSGVTNIAEDLAKALHYIEQYYTRGLYEFARYLLEDQTPPELGEVVRMCSEQLIDSFNDSLVYSSQLEHKLSKEVENGRLVRLLTKLGVATERPEYATDEAWSETGERYPIKMFQDYLFHDGDGEYQDVEIGGGEQARQVRRGVDDLGHILRTLNKLDAGIDEQIMLVSRDEQTYVVMSYKEVSSWIKFHCFFS